MVRLIVNADDFGYAPGVSRGIVECANQGIVTATGLMGNAPDLCASVALLAAVPQLETGVHLVLTHGQPLTEVMRLALKSTGARFPGKFTMARLISLRRVDRVALRSELEAQVNACLSAGAQVAFLNAHEHLHMHPLVFPIVAELAKQFGIRHVRITRPDVVTAGPAGFIRGLIIRAAAAAISASEKTQPRFIGLSPSGRLDYAYLELAFARLIQGQVYELMCHPGYPDESLLQDSALRAYHDWDLERRTLQDVRLPGLLARHQIELVRFSDLSASATAN